MAFAFFAGFFLFCSGALACQFELPAIASVQDPKSVHLLFPARAVSLSQTLWGSCERPIELARYHFPSPKPSNDGYQPISFGVKEFEASLRAFARDGLDARSVTHFSQLPDSTSLKMHLATGEMLILNKQGHVGLYLRLPVDQRSVAAYVSTAHLFSHLVETVSLPSRGEKVARLSAGESMEFGGFISGNSLAVHVDKHVLGLAPEVRQMPLAYKANFAMGASVNRPPEFEALRTNFALAIKNCAEDRGCAERAYTALKMSYMQAAEKFLKSERATSLTYTRKEIRQFDGAEHVMAYRFDVLTRELAVIDRGSGKVTTYFRLNMDIANRSLADHQFPPAHSPFEYFLALPQLTPTNK